MASGASSHFVCARCGLVVHKIGLNDAWKHCANRFVKSCGKPPLITRRQSRPASPETV